MPETNLIQNPSRNQDPNYRVLINHYVVAEFPDIGPAINHAWQLCRQQNIPPEFVNIKAKNHAGLWSSIWSDDLEEDVKILPFPKGGPR